MDNTPAQKNKPQDAWEDRCPTCHRVRRDGVIEHAGNCNIPLSAEHIGGLFIGEHPATANAVSQPPIRTAEELQSIMYGHDNTAFGEVPPQPHADREYLREITELGEALMSALNRTLQYRIQHSEYYVGRLGDKELDFAKKSLTEAIMWAKVGITGE